MLTIDLPAALIGDSDDRVDVEVMSVAGTVKARKDGRALGESVLHVSSRVPPVFPGPGVVVITVGTVREGEAMRVVVAAIAFEGASCECVHQLMPVRNVGDWARGGAVEGAEALRRRTALRCGAWLIGSGI